MSDAIKLKKIEEAWLGLDGIDESKIIIPTTFADTNHDDFELRLSYLMAQSEYFSLLCKEILNIQLLPMQCLFLDEMWKRKFPMLIASRGFGKALKPNESVRVKDGWKKIKDIEVGDKVYGSNGSLCNVTHTTFLQRGLNMYRVTLHDGRQIECCEDHMWKVWDKNKSRSKTEPVWSELKTKDMVDNYFWKRDGEKFSGIEYRYALPINKAIEETEKRFDLHPYILGVVLGGGCISQDGVIITTKDIEIINKVEKLLPEGYKISKLKEEYSYSIVMNGASKSFVSYFEELDLRGCDSETKFIPNIYKFGSIDQRLELIRGLMDTDGYSNSQSVIEYYTISKKLSDDFLEVLRSLGFYCDHSIKESWFKISIYTDKEVFSLSRKLEYLNHTLSKRGQSKYEKVFITKIEYIGKGDGHCITVDNEDHTYITKDYIVTHNSFGLSLYAILRALILDGRKIVVVGAAFRQSKVLFEYMETIWKNSPILRSMCDDKSGPKRDNDRCTMRINNSVITCLPLGDGTKIRGQRANDIIADEFACLQAGSLVETKQGFVRVEDFDNYDIYNGLNSTERPEKFIKTPLTDVYEIKLENGYVIRCSENHQVMTNNGWKTPLNLTDNDYIEKSPVNSFCRFSNKELLTKKEAWLMGLLVSDGSVTDSKRISITTTNEKLCEKLVNRYDFKFSIKEAYVDDRGWNCKKSYKLYKDDENLRNKFYDLGLEYVKAIDKKIPNCILRSNGDIVYSFMSGLFEGDGSCFLWTDKNVENKIGLAYYSVSQRLCRDVQTIMYHLGFDGHINKRNSEISNNKQWFVRWDGRDAKILGSYLNVERFKSPIQNCVVTSDPPYITWDESRKKWKVQYNLLGKQIQKRFKDKYSAEDYLEKLKGKNNFRKVISITKLDKQENLYDYYLPKTNTFFAEGHKQHNSIPRDIFETVVAGFAAVSSNPIDNVKRVASEKMAKNLGIELEPEQIMLGKQRVDNQIIWSGTAYYEFNHFADYWKRNKKIIESRGNIRKLEEVFGEGEVPDGFDWTQYSIIRVPYELLPEGFMDADQVARSKATVHSGIYQMEFGAVFTRDSQGFFKRSLIEGCVPSADNVIKKGDDSPIEFEPMLMGDPKKKYILGVDPASEVDNFSIVVLEVNPDHRKIVHCWTTSRSQHKDFVKSGFSTERDFYGYCARKIRDLMSRFPCVHIAMDAQGGGIAVMEALHDPKKIKEGEHLIWETIDEDKPKDSDDEKGLHILEMCQFAKYDWLAEANHGMKKDFEDKILLFPKYDGATWALTLSDDELKERAYDTMEDCVLDIEELKNELSIIEISQTSSGRDKWDTPEVVVGVGKKERIRKDRYSSLLMANMAARTIERMPSSLIYEFYGGFADTKSYSKSRKKRQGEGMYQAPQWFNSDGWMK